MVEQSKFFFLSKSQSFINKQYLQVVLSEEVEVQYIVQQALHRVK